MTTPAETPTDVDGLRIYRSRQLLVELHEFIDDGWRETHRWNHGLMEDLLSKDTGVERVKGSRWTGPHLPNVSLAGMSAFNDALRPEFVFLSVDEEEAFKSIVGCIMEPLVRLGAVAAEHQGEAGALLLEHLSSQVKPVVAHTKSFDFDEADGEAATVEPVEDGQILHDDPLRPDADEETVHVLVDSIAQLSQKVVAIFRLKSKTDTGLEEQWDHVQSSARFIVLVLGPEKADVEHYRQIGQAAASLFQDDKVVRSAYECVLPQELVDAIQERLWQLRLMPQVSRPTQRGMRKRSLDMLKQMQEVASEPVLQRSQTHRWLLQQNVLFSYGFSLKSLVSMCRKFAVPLLSGIVLALVMANADPNNYDKWAGYGHDGGDASHDAHTQRPTVFGLSLHGHGMTPHFIVNDVLMAFFFGLAAKEICEAVLPGGSLYPPTRSTVNVLAATLGGVVGPIAVFMLLLAILSAAGALDKGSFGDYAIGWGVPTATDISLAWVTAVFTFGKGHPAINYLLLLAIVDDGIGLLIIAIAYPDPENPVRPVWLLLILAAMAVAFCLRRLRCVHWQMYIFIAGPIAWFGLVWAALHPSLALVFVVPFMPKQIDNDELDLPRWLLKPDSDSDEEAGHGHSRAHGHGAPLHEFEEAVSTYVDFGVLFLFGAVNAGVKLDSFGILSIVVLLALVLGKTIGITVGSSVATLCGCSPPQGMGMFDVVALGFIASVGLTVALFISGEAYEDAEFASQAKMGSLLSISVPIVAAGVKVLFSLFSRGVSSNSDVKRAISTYSVHSAHTTHSTYSTQSAWDIALEEVIVKDAVRNLNQLQQAEEAVEKTTGMTRADSIQRLSRHAHF